MKETKITDVEPYVFDGHLILSLSSDWIRVCNGIPKFKVTITSSELRLTTPLGLHEEIQEEK